jgi:hypothetical protein
VAADEKEETACLPALDDALLVSREEEGPGSSAHQSLQSPRPPPRHHHSLRSEIGGARQPACNGGGALTRISVHVFLPRVPSGECSNFSSPRRMHGRLLRNRSGPTQSREILSARSLADRTILRLGALGGSFRGQKVAMTIGHISPGSRTSPSSSSSSFFLARSLTSSLELILSFASPGELFYSAVHEWVGGCSPSSARPRVPRQY